MKTVARLSALVVLCLVAISAFAAESKTVPVSLNWPTIVNGTSLKAGDYQMVVTINGTDVKAVFLNREKKEVASADGTFVPQKSFPTPVSVVVGSDNGNRTLKEVWVSKMKGAILFASNAKPDSSKQ